MPYCTKADILKKVSSSQLLQMTDDNNTGGIDNSIVTQMIADADSEIDGWVGKKYTVPLSPIPAIVQKLSVDIAVYNLYGRSVGVPDDKAERYRNAITFLKGVAKGDATLGEDDPGGIPQSQPIEVTGQTRTFSRDTLKGY